MGKDSDEINGNYPRSPASFQLNWRRGKVVSRYTIINYTDRPLQKMPGFPKRAGMTILRDRVSVMHLFMFIYLQIRDAISFLVISN